MWTWILNKYKKEMLEAIEKNDENKLDNKGKTTLSSRELKKEETSLHLKGK